MACVFFILAIIVFAAILTIYTWEPTKITNVRWTNEVGEEGRPGLLHLNK